MSNAALQTFKYKKYIMVVVTDTMVDTYIDGGLTGLSAKTAVRFFAHCLILEKKTMLEYTTDRKAPPMSGNATLK